MRVLLISNQHLSAQGLGNPIMMRMFDALKKDARVERVEFAPFYNRLRSFVIIRQEAKNYDIVHVHFGGCYALLVRLILCGIQCKKYITFHGTDIHAKALKTTDSVVNKIKIILNQKASFQCIRLYDRCGFVSLELMDYVPVRLSKLLSRKSFLHPLGVDYEIFQQMNSREAQDYLGLSNKHYALFSDVSSTPIKRRDIAISIIQACEGRFELLVMSGVRPDVVPYYINACDFVLLTSDEEGSPSIIREALSLSKPVFSVAVGDAEKQLEGLSNSSIISRDPMVAASVIMKKMQERYTDDTRTKLKSKLDFTEINRQIVSLYEGDLQMAHNVK